MQEVIDQKLEGYIRDFLKENRAGRILARGLEVLGVGLWPVIDHLAFCCLSVEQRAKEFLDLGYRFDEETNVLQGRNWWAKIFKKPGYPAVLLCQAYEDERVKQSPIPAWVDAFGEKMVHCLAVHVENAENAVFYLEKQGIPFSHHIVGDQGSKLRQVLSVPEKKNGMVYCTLQFVERRGGFQELMALQLEELHKILESS
ncbi:MAG: hypothetical protein JW893_06520 [Candidatus Omnitrophica bacterium]|nr:hypothetical protein [Candidatus Omnitrophota bacterium]